MSMINTIIDAIRGFINFVKGLVKTIVTAFIHFVKDIVDYFKNLKLNPQKQIPYIAKADQFREMLKNAPKKNIGIFEGVYNEETEEIEDARYIGADDMDEKTKELLGEEELVVLT